MKRGNYNVRNRNDVASLALRLFGRSRLLRQKRLIGEGTLVAQVVKAPLTVVW
jgi:hypothetical protein